MGLDVVCVDHEDIAQSEDKVFQAVMRYLRQHYPAMSSLQFGKMPAALADGERVGSYGWLHVLRGLAVLHQQGAALTDLSESDLSKAAEKYYEQSSASAEAARYPHLLNHSDCDGYYMPIDLPDPLYITWTPAPDDEDYDEPVTTSVGSSQRLLQELNALAPVLGLEKDLTDCGNENEFGAMVDQHRWPTAAWVWGVLRAYARGSVDHNLIVVFC